MIIHKPTLKVVVRVSVHRYYNCKQWPTRCNYFVLFIYS